MLYFIEYLLAGSIFTGKTGQQRTRRSVLIPLKFQTAWLFET